MALWGNKDLKAANGASDTVTVTASGTCTFSANVNATGVIDVGDWIGLEVDGQEFFGEILEFDDDEGTVTIETEDGEEITGDQEDMFLDDE